MGERDPVWEQPLLFALLYARRGWRVLPLFGIVDGRCECAFTRKDCTREDPYKWGKHPRTLNGFYDATADEDQIREWWKMWPLANIGIRTGDGLIGYDVDPRNGGEETYADRLVGQDDVACPTVLTGSGGLHLYFAGHEERTGHSAGGRGVDIKCEGGYLVAPPSVHGTGGRYTWLKYNTEPPTMPDWLRPAPKPSPNGTLPLRERPHGRPYAIGALRGECERASARRDGQGRRNELYEAGLKLAKYVISGELTPDVVERALQVAGVASGLSADQAASHARNGLMCGLGQVATR